VSVLNSLAGRYSRYGVKNKWGRKLSETYKGPSLLSPPSAAGHP
jgi:hypothetical protein